MREGHGLCRTSTLALPAFHGAGVFAPRLDAPQTGADSTRPMNRANSLTLLLAAALGAAAHSSRAEAREEPGPKIEAARPVPGVAGAVAPVGARLRIATYNIEEFTDGVDDAPMRSTGIAARHARMAAAILDQAAADVVVLQEIENADALAMLNRDLRKPFAAAAITAYGDGTARTEKMNDAVLSRVPLERPTELDFSPLTGTNRPTRGLLRFEIPLGEGRRLLVYTGHLKSNYGPRERAIAERRAALEILRADAAQVTADPNAQWEVFFAGDTNVDPEQPEFATDPSFQPLAGWLDLWHQVKGPERATCPTRLGDPAQEFPPACFDRVFVTPSLTNAPWTAGLPKTIPEGCETSDIAIPPGYGSHVSDHFPVYLDLSR
jgi:endonuclease/exonuclease/phosphatase family metal-dependent hydrolase